MSEATQQFAAWLQDQHPEVYAALYPLAIAHLPRRATLRGFGDDTSSYDFSSFSEPTLSDIGTSVSPDVMSAPNVSAFTSDTSSSWASGLLNAAESVGSWITSPQGLTALTNVGTAIIKTQQTQAIASTQLAVIQAQAARAAAGLPPAPIGYTPRGQPVYNASAGLPYPLEQAVNNGQVQPVQLPDGSVGYTLTPPLLQSVLGTGIPAWAWLVGAGALVLILTR